MGENGVLAPSKIYFHTASHFAKKALYHLSNAGIYSCSNTYEIQRENYGEYLFLHIKKGKMKINYKTNEYYATDNTFVFLNCNERHLYAAMEYTEFDWFHFSGNASHEYFNFLFKQHGCVYSLEKNWSISAYMNQVLAMLQNNRVDEQEASIVIQQILTELSKLSYKSDNVVRDSIHMSINYIETHFNEDITLTDIARFVQLSSFHFSRLFKKYMGCSPYHYLINYRINHAKELLYKTQLSINEVADACGFNSASHFVTTFKKHNNISPKQFRCTYF